LSARKRILAPGLVPVVGEWEEQPDAAVLGELQNELRLVADVDARRPAKPEEWREAVRSANIIAGPPRTDRAFLTAANELEMLQTFGIGYDQIDVEACTNGGIIVCNVGEVYSEPVAQHAWAMILALSKQVVRADRAMRSATWRKHDWRGMQLWGKTLGVLGLGGIGGRIALKGWMAFNMRVIACDPYVLPARAQLYGAELVNMDKLFSESDVLVVSLPLTKATRHLVAGSQLSLMKKTAVLVNVCRGPIVDQDSLVKCLRDGVISGAGLDVFEAEPLPEDSPLLKMENVVLTPHIASSTVEAVDETYRGAVNNIIDYLEGRRPSWIVNPEAYGKRVH
jgi:phosphoglycerate dehydrogenase-like enzyme